MKKYLATILSALLLLAQCAPAMANGYGLLGGIYDIVSDDDAYDAYTALADSGNALDGGEHVNQAILSSRYHNQLIAAVREGKVWKADTVSTRAVYQPGDARNVRPVLAHTGGGFTLTYDRREEFTFCRTDSGYFLRDVRFDLLSNYANSIQWTEDEGYRGYLFWESGVENSWERIGDALWLVDKLDLSRFNIDQLPRSIADVRRMNTVSAALRTDCGWLTVQEQHLGARSSRKLAVYAAPDAKAYRAASGKASVSTGGEMALYGEYDGWTMVEYAVSQRTGRIGFVNAQLMSRENPLPLLETPAALVTARDTFLTDDPQVSQYPQMTLPAGTPVEGLAQFDAFYALVRIPGTNQPIWGFVPLRDLSLAQDDACWDVMERLIGKWRDPAGDPSLYVLYAGGEYRAVLKDEDYTWLGEEWGRWRIVACPADAAYPGDPLYELVFTDEEGTEARFGLQMQTDGSILLLTEEGSTRFVRNEYSTYGNG